MPVLPDSVADGKSSADPDARAVQDVRGRKQGVRRPSRDVPRRCRVDVRWSNTHVMEDTQFGEDVGFIFDGKGLMYNLTLEGSKISRMSR